MGHRGCSVARTFPLRVDNQKVIHGGAIDNPVDPTFHYRPQGRVWVEAVLSFVV